MYDLSIDKKTGFRLVDPYKPLIIRDKRGLLFYTNEFLLPKVKAFNLPAGDYTVDTGMIKALPEPVKYRLIKLPFRPQRVYPNPIGFDFHFDENPNKCTINFVEKTITFDNSFKECTLPQIYFILYHEYGHRFFKSEKLCDLFSMNCMLIKGFNPSQIGAAPITTLSCRQIDRKNFSVKKLIEKNGVNS